jgi:hypothetical protein
MCHFDPSIHGADPSVAGALPYEAQPRPHSSIVPTVLGVIAVAASVFSTCIFCITGGLLPLGCAVAAGLLAVFLFSRSRDNDGPQRQAAQVVHHVYQQNSPPPAVFVSHRPVWVETLQPHYRPPSPAREVISVPVIPQPVSRPSGEDHVRVRSHRPVFSPPVARPRGEDRVQVRSHRPTLAPATDWFAPAADWFAPATGGLDANAHIGVGNGSTNGVQPFGGEARIPVGRGGR